MKKYSLEYTSLDPSINKCYDYYDGCLCGLIKINSKWYGYNMWDEYNYHAFDFYNFISNDIDKFLYENDIHTKDGDSDLSVTEMLNTDFYKSMTILEEFIKIEDHVTYGLISKIYKFSDSILQMLNNSSDRKKCFTIFKESVEKSKCVGYGKISRTKYDVLIRE